MDAQPAIGAGDHKAAASEFHIVFRGFQEMRGDLLALSDDLLANQDDGSAAHRGRARTARAHSKRDSIRIALDKFDLLWIDAELIHQHLSLDGPVALTMRNRPRNESHSSQRVKTDFGGLDRRIGGLFDGVGEADAAQHAALASFFPGVPRSPSNHRASWRDPYSLQNVRCHR